MANKGCAALHCTVPYRIVSYRIVSHRIVSYCILSYRIVSYRIVPYCIVLYLCQMERLSSIRSKLAISSVNQITYVMAQEDDKVEWIFGTRTHRSGQPVLRNGRRSNYPPQKNKELHIVNLAPVCSLICSKLADTYSPPPKH